MGRLVGEGVNIVLGSLLCLLTGTMLGMLIRSSAGALVAYFVYHCSCPPCPASWPPARSGSATCSHGLTLNFAQAEPCSRALIFG